MNIVHYTDTQLHDLVEGNSQCNNIIMIIFNSSWSTYKLFLKIFLDSFLRMRDKTDHEATAMMKAQFMSLWDGKQIVTEKLLCTL